MKQEGILTIVLKSIQHLEGFLICHFLLYCCLQSHLHRHKTCHEPQAALFIQQAGLLVHFYSVVLVVKVRRRHVAFTS